MLQVNSEDVALYHVSPQDDEDAVIDRALSILGTRLRSGRQEFNKPAAVKTFCALQIGDLEHEVFAVLFLDSQHRLVAFEQIFRGTLTQTSVYPREVVKLALKHNAGAVILTHNHPSGSVEPSRADEALTLTLKSALALVDVRVIDHVIVGGSTSLSMAEKGLI
jgi:DNA repair protein RadC